MCCSTLPRKGTEHWRRSSLLILTLPNSVFSLSVPKHAFSPSKSLCLMLYFQSQGKAIHSSTADASLSSHPQHLASLFLPKFHVFDTKEALCEDE